MKTGVSLLQTTPEANVSQSSVVLVNQLSSLIKTTNSQHYTALSGLIYVVGGVTELGSELTSVESFNPVTHEWTPLNSMHTARAYTGVAAIDNNLYAVGGWNDNGTLQSVEKYNIEEVSQMNI